MFFYIKVSTKDKRVLDDFNQLIKEFRTTIGFLNFFPKPDKREFITVLRSPHVNKTAQEQFEYRFYTREFFIVSFKPLTLFLILKKMSTLSLFGLDLRIKNIVKKSKHDRLSAMNPDNFRLRGRKDCYDLRKIQNFQSSKRYIQLFDCYGETCLKHNLHTNVKN